jgi:hypothetical protein
MVKGLIWQPVDGERGGAAAVFERQGDGAGVGLCEAAEAMVKGLIWQPVDGERGGAAAVCQRLGDGAGVGLWEAAAAMVKGLIWQPVVLLLGWTCATMVSVVAQRRFLSDWEMLMVWGYGRLRTPW